MGKDLKKGFHTKAFNYINTFSNIVNRLSKQAAFVDSYKKAPDLLKNGRTIHQIVFDDLMNAFAGVMRDIPDQDIPKSFHMQLLVYRNGKAPTDQEAADHLAALMKKAQALKEGEVQTPDFLTLFSSTVPENVVSNILNNWIAVVNTFGHLMHTEEALDVEQKATDISVYVSTFQRKRSEFDAKQNENLGKIVGGAGSVADDDADYDEFSDESDDVLTRLSNKINKIKMSPEATKRAKKELARLTQMNPQSSEFSVLTNYLDLLTSLPWNKESKVNLNLKKTEDILHKDHYGMQKVKDAITEHVAVQNRVGKNSGQILLLVGPPGVGKTSIAESVAKATGRQYVRMSLGGVSDEAKIRGHKMTYVGAMPGELIKAMIAAGTTNPLIVLDEIDKIGRNGAHGDPTAALLEALDPAQNHAFKDNFLDVDYDMSNVMFFCTANSFGNIPGPLRDRMEVIHLPGYLQDEKFEIAKRYLMPKQLSKKKLADSEVKITDEALNRMINEYTAEAGVRKLEQVINEVCRKAVVEFAKGRKTPITVTADNLETYAGVSHVKHDKVHAEDAVGIVNGLAYTTIGGCRLPIQAVTIPSKGFRLTATGRLGDVMKESITVAERFVRSNAGSFGISQQQMEKVEVHLHAPEGAVPKDGPSAGLAMTTVIISALTGRKIRHDLAMTGEIDLVGNAMKIGGLPEKLEGALRAGVKTVVIPRDNVGDLANVPDTIKSKLNIVPVDTIHDVLKAALVSPVVSLEQPKQPRTLKEVFADIQKLTEEAAEMSNVPVAGNDNTITLNKKPVQEPKVS